MNRLRFALLATMPLLAGCPTPPPEIVNTLYLASDAYGGRWSFDGGGVETPEGKRETKPDLGALRRAGHDQASGVTAVVYDNWIAAFDASNVEVEWHRVSTPPGRTEVAVCDRLLGIVADDCVRVIDLESGDVLVDESDVVQTWLKKDGDDVYDFVSFVLPLDSERMILVSGRGGTAADSGGALVEVVDHSAGRWKQERKAELGRVGRPGACGNVGEVLYVMGSFENHRNAPNGGRMRLFSELLLYGLDESLRIKEYDIDEISQTQKDAVDLLVVENVASENSHVLGFLTRRGVVQVFRLNTDDGTHRRVKRSQFEGAASLAWKDDDNFVVILSSGETRPLSLIE